MVALWAKTSGLPLSPVENLRTTAASRQQNGMGKGILRTPNSYPFMKGKTPKPSKAPFCSRKLKENNLWNWNCLNQSWSIVCFLSLQFFQIYGFPDIEQKLRHVLFWPRMIHFCVPVEMKQLLKSLMSMQKFMWSWYILMASDVEHDILLSHPEKATSSHVELLALRLICKVHLWQLFLQSISFVGQDSGFYYSATA